MNTSKKWIIVFISALLICLILVSSVVISIDPFFYYHKPLKIFNYTYDDSFYQGAGIIKNFEYSTFITGTSLIQNMKPSTIKAITQEDAVKVPFCGKDIETICNGIKLAIKSQPKLKNVVMNIDSNLLTTRINSSSDFPKYLYDKNIFNDVKYVLNKDVIFEKCVSVIKEKDKIESMDTAFSSEKQFYFAEFSSKDQVKEPFNTSESNFYNTITSNLKILENIIKENPKIKFFLFIPPHNVMYLKMCADNNQLHYHINAYKKIYETLSKYDNVSISSFQDEIDIAGNLYNYCDSIHFSSYVSDIIINSLFTGKNKLDNQNYISKLNNIKTVYDNFDYSVFSSERFPFKSETDIEKYIYMIKDYIVILNCSDSFVPSAKAIASFGNIGINDLNSENSNNVYLNGKKYVADNFDCRIKNNSIIINQIDYSLQLKDGINIVIYSPDLNRVIDSAYINNDKVVHERDRRK
ncbi:MAG: hypothetical protein MJ230_07885 [bacterium]|nr:hypothetical protein [bacterium]